MLQLSTDCLALRAAAIGLFEPLGPAILGGCLRLPLSLRQTTTRATTRAFSGCRAVPLGTRSLHIPVISLCWYFLKYNFDNSTRLLFSPVEWNEGCRGVCTRPSVVINITVR